MKKSFAALVATLLLVACNGSGSTPAPEPAPPSDIQNPTESPPVWNQPLQEEKSAVTIFLYENPEDEVKIQEQLVALEIELEESAETPEEEIEAALTKLFSLKEPVYDSTSWRTALYASNLSVAEVALKDGVMEVFLEGDFVGTGAVADAFMKPQIESTIGQYAKPYRIFLNGTEKNWECVLDYQGNC